jgi:hypothetical protein
MWLINVRFYYTLIQSKTSRIFLNAEFSTLGTLINVNK